jgi:predicted DNA-binding protein
MSETLTIRLGEQLAEALREESQQTGLPKGEIARQALEERLRTDRKLTVMRHYFGAVRGAADLSSNKTYRRNWGKRRA